MCINMLMQKYLETDPSKAQDSLPITKARAVTKGQQTLLPYFGKRKQVTKNLFLVKEQNVSVISTDVNGIS